MSKLKESFENFILPSYREIPDVGLYLDQVVKYINSWFADFPDMNVTASMLTNYVKLKIVSRSGKKTYSRRQIAAFLFIAMAKSVLSMDNIRTIMEMNGESELEQFYESFRQNMMNVLKYLSEENGSLSNAACMLNNICIAIGHKMYLELYFSEMKQRMAEYAGNK